MEATLTNTALLETVVRAADSKKASRLVALDLQGVSTMADYFVIADAPSERQVRAIVDEIKDKAQEFGVADVKLEGYQQSEWVLLNLGDVIVHVFASEQRDFYNLERLWGDAPYVDLTDWVIED
ncbi:MAG TPA: ribosome silencing factor [Lactobacillaceae bacterium]